jgi:hypothetical protein
MFFFSSETFGDFNRRLKSIESFFYNGTNFASVFPKQTFRILLRRIAANIGCLFVAPSFLIDVFLSRRWGLGLAPVMMYASSACELVASWHIHSWGRIGDSPPTSSWTCTPFSRGCLAVFIFGVNNEF